MEALKNIIRQEKAEGEPVRRGEMTVTPVSSSFILLLPFGGMVRSRPVEALVRRGGREERIPVRDVTSIMQKSIITMVAAASFFTFIFSRYRRRD